jgi:hypothetical protein
VSTERAVLINALAAAARDTPRVMRPAYPPSTLRSDWQPSEPVGPVTTEIVYAAPSEASVASVAAPVVPLEDEPEFLIQIDLRAWRSHLS